MEERFGMAQFSSLLGHTELNWRPTELVSVEANDGGGGYADPGGGQAFGQAGPTSATIDDGLDPIWL
jgi:hypothetical protein